MTISPFSPTWRNDILRGLGSFVGIALDTDGTLAADSDMRVPSQKAVNTKIDLTLSSLPCFAANKNGTAQTGIANTSTLTKLTFTNEKFDIGGYYDSANSKWTPPAGIAELAARATFNITNMNGQGIVYLLIYKNGSNITRAQRAMPGSSGSGSTNQLGVEVSTKEMCNGTDYFEVYAGMDTTSGTGAVIGSSANTEFSGKMIAVS